MHTTMDPVQVKTLKIQAGVQVSRQGELGRHLQLWKTLFVLYLYMIGTLKKEISLNYNNSFLGEYECSSLALDRDERRDEKKRLDNLKQDQTVQENSTVTAGGPGGPRYIGGPPSLSRGLRRLTLLFLSFSGKGVRFCKFSMSCSLSSRAEFRFALNSIEELSREPSVSELFLRTHQNKKNKVFVDTTAKATWEGCNAVHGADDALNAQSGNGAKTYPKWIDRVGSKNRTAYGVGRFGKVVANEVGKAVAEEVGKATQQILDAIRIRPV
ncbi:hypothetical protein Tco_1006183 [Tanacetum coccineum]|uniref:Uncharacterized protein n=1 Tax=Tanacetum coccineum TaxID=301880 RepID=A0ABQ5FH60_9ASTR